MELCKPTQPQSTSAVRFTVAPAGSKFTPSTQTPSASPADLIRFTRLYPWELSDVLEEDNDITNPGTGAAPAFQSVKVMPKKAAGLEEKHAADLAAAMPFLFEPEPASSEQADPFANPDARPVIATKKAPARFRSRWFASLKDREGKRMKAFGPERVVEDP